jgi:hypothetical protein
MKQTNMIRRVSILRQQRTWYSPMLVADVSRCTGHPDPIRRVLPIAAWSRSISDAVSNAFGTSIHDQGLPYTSSGGAQWEKTY